MTEPFLDFSDICMVFKGVGRGRGAQEVRVEAIDLNARGGVLHGQHLVHAVKKIII